MDLSKVTMAEAGGARSSAHDSSFGQWQQPMMAPNVMGSALGGHRTSWSSGGATPGTLTKDVHEQHQPTTNTETASSESSGSMGDMVVKMGSMESNGDSTGVMGGLSLADMDALMGDDGTLGEGSEDASALLSLLSPAMRSFARTPLPLWDVTGQASPSSLSAHTSFNHYQQSPNQRHHDANGKFRFHFPETGEAHSYAETTGTMAYDSTTSLPGFLSVKAEMPGDQGQTTIMSDPEPMFMEPTDEVSSSGGPYKACPTLDGICHLYACTDSTSC